MWEEEKEKESVSVTVSIWGSIQQVFYQDTLHCPLFNYHWLVEDTENNIRPNSLGLQGIQAF